MEILLDCFISIIVQSRFLNKANIYIILSFGPLQIKCKKSFLLIASSPTVGELLTTVIQRPNGTQHLSKTWVYLSSSNATCYITAARTRAEGIQDVAHADASSRSTLSNTLLSKDVCHRLTIFQTISRLGIAAGCPCLRLRSTYIVAVCCVIVRSGRTLRKRCLQAQYQYRTYSN
jgi:hypothetical protein